ncbi:helix-turn-helix domain-containing protein [Longibaculum muris]|uniref:helix-turn-helix domain-containing protein n=1 Tax=Longibaculum muris TaxID=1796628 RepID=UPI0022E52D7C|nr:helix-turn-helix transcriptional regulator [Longibaculum muris]
MIVDYKAMGKRITIARIRKGIIQEETAELSSISSRHMSNIETGRTKTSLPMLIAIVNALDTSVDCFLCDNVVKSGYVFKEEANKLFLDCNDYEMRIIMNIVLATKESLRQEFDIRKRLYED